MDTHAFRGVIDAAIERARAGMSDHLTQGLSEIRGELIYLNAARNRAGEKPRDVVARSILERSKRFKFFSRDLFADPAWDILLALALARFDGRELAIKEAVLAAAVPVTTALRWLAVLEIEGLVNPRPDPNDGRRVFVRLSDEGWDRFSDWIESNIA